MSNLSLITSLLDYVLGSPETCFYMTKNIHAGVRANMHETIVKRTKYIVIESYVIPSVHM